MRWFALFLNNIKHFDRGFVLSSSTSGPTKALLIVYVYTLKALCAFTLYYYYLTVSEWQSCTIYSRAASLDNRYSSFLTCWLYFLCAEIFLDSIPPNTLFWQEIKILKNQQPKVMTGFPGHAWQIIECVWTVESKCLPCSWDVDVGVCVRIKLGQDNGQDHGLRLWCFLWP